MLMAHGYLQYMCTVLTG